MRITLILVLITVPLLFLACATAEPEPAEEPATAEAQPEPEPEAAPDAVGAEFADGTEAVTLADLAADPASFNGKTIRVQGTAAHLCGSGCSMTLAEGEAKLKCRTDVEKFKFPAGWKDGVVEVEGVIEVDPGCDHHKKAEGEGEGHEGHDHAEHADHAEDGEVKYVMMVTGARVVPAEPAEDAAPAEGEAAEAPAAE